MKYNETVSIVCDQKTFQSAVAVRSALESFRLRTHLHLCIHTDHVLDALKGGDADSSFVVLLCHGESDNPGEALYDLCFHVMEERYDKWHEFEMRITPQTVAGCARLRDKTVMVLGSGGGEERYAKAFLGVDCRAYIGPVGKVHVHSATLFAISFFYNLLAEERDPTFVCTERRAAELAASIDIDFREGGRLFRFHSR